MFITAFRYGWLYRDWRMHIFLIKTWFYLENVRKHCLNLDLDLILILIFINVGFVSNTPIPLCLPSLNRRCCQTGKGSQPGATCPSHQSTLTAAPTSPVWPATQQCPWANAPQSILTSTVRCSFSLWHREKRCRRGGSADRDQAVFVSTHNKITNFNQLLQHPVNPKYCNYQEK